MSDSTSNTAPVFAVAYLRVSTAEQVDSLSLPAQADAVAAFCVRAGATLLETFREEGVSGIFFHARHALQSAVAKCRALRAAHPDARILFVTPVLDRAGRDVDVLRDIDRQLARLRVEFVGADGFRSDRTATGRLMFNTQAGFAEYERLKIRERSMGGKVKTAREGRQPATAVRPYGYQIVRKRDIYPGSAFRAGEEGTYVIAAGEAAHVREMFARYAAGASIREVARYMNDMAAKHGGEANPIRGGKAWQPGTISTILANSVYVGRAVYGRREHRREETAQGNIVRYSTRAAKETVIEIPCPAIVDQALWNEVQARRAENPRALGGNPDRKHLLSGLLVCPECGRRLFRLSGSGGKRAEGEGRAKSASYGCNFRKGATTDPVFDCSGRNYHAGLLEHLTLRAISEVATRPEIVAGAIARRNRKKTPTIDTAALAREMAELSRRESVAVGAELVALADGRDTDAYRDVLRQISLRRREVQDLIQSAPDVAEKPTDINAAAIIDTLSRVGRILSDPRLPVADRIRALRLIVVEVHPKDTGKKISRADAIAIGLPSRGPLMRDTLVDVVLRPILQNESPHRVSQELSSSPFGQTKNGLSRGKTADTVARIMIRLSNGNE